MANTNTTNDGSGNLAGGFDTGNPEQDRQKAMQEALGEKERADLQALQDRRDELVDDITDARVEAVKQAADNAKQEAEDAKAEAEAAEKEQEAENEADAEFDSPQARRNAEAAERPDGN